MTKQIRKNSRQLFSVIKEKIYRKSASTAIVEEDERIDQMRDINIKQKIS